MRRALYPGSFDPPTYGHLDLVERASRLYDEVIVAVGVNSSKKPFLPADLRVEALKRCTGHLKNLHIESFSGLLIEHARMRQVASIIRGLRATSDFEYEFQMAMVNRRIAEDIETVFLMTKWDHSYLSSSIVREVALLGGDFSTMVPPGVRDLLEDFLRQDA